MKFSGEIKFPEIDHPGVPIQFVIEGRQAELVVEGESLGRWSLYDVHARRLVASAFQIDLDGTEITFVADDPIDFAYRGVEHMAETWAGMKSKQMGRRMVTVRKSRKGTIASRIDELRAAMEANLEVQSRPLAGEPVTPAAAPETATVAERGPGDWDRRDASGAIPLVGESEEQTPLAPQPDEAAAAHLDARVAEEMARLEEEKQRILEERARLETERLEAEQRETVRIEAYRLEMQRLEAEREELRIQAALAAERAEEIAARAGQPEEPVAPTIEVEESAAVVPVDDEEEAAAEAAALEGDGSVPDEPEPVDATDEPEPVDKADEPEPVDKADEPEPVDKADEPEPVDKADEPEPAASEGDEPGSPGDEEAGAVAGRHVVDLSDLEEGRDGAEPDEVPGATTPPQPQPALAGVAPTRERGLRGAVRAAFARGGREHEHEFIEAPGGIGITRYVCEVCGYVSISVDD